MRNLAIILAVSLLALFQATDARACKCVPPPPVAAAVEGAAAVFAGRIASVSRETDPTTPLLARFTVSRAWKGAVGEVVEVRTPSSSAACGLSFEEGAEWLVYAEMGENGLSASICSRSKPLDAATEDLAQLGNGTVPGSSGPPPAAPPGSGGCACELAPEGVAPCWGAAAALVGLGAIGVRRRGRRRAGSR